MILRFWSFGYLRWISGKIANSLVCNKWKVNTRLTSASDFSATPLFINKYGQKRKKMSGNYGFYFSFRLTLPRQQFICLHYAEHADNNFSSTRWCASTFQRVGKHQVFYLFQKRVASWAWCNIVCGVLSPFVGTLIVISLLHRFTFFPTSGIMADGKGDASLWNCGEGEGIRLILKVYRNQIEQTQTK
jgi:hypothetical protein